MEVSFGLGFSQDLPNALDLNSGEESFVSDRSLSIISVSTLPIFWGCLEALVPYPFFFGFCMFSAFAF